MEELKPIIQTKRKIGEKIKYYLISSWYFEKAYEKIILIALVVLGSWKIINLIFGV